MASLNTPQSQAGVLSFYDAPERGRSYKLTEIAKDLNMDEDGARGILCILSESGDVMEGKKELFSIA